MPNAVSSELCCLAPERAKSKHSTLWLKGHLSRGGNPASFPKSINRGGLLSRGAAHCHGNAPSELGSLPNPAPSHLRSCFLGLGGSLRILAVCSAEGEGDGGVLRLTFSVNRKTSSQEMDTRELEVYHRVCGCLAFSSHTASMGVAKDRLLYLRIYVCKNICIWIYLVSFE